MVERGDTTEASTESVAGIVLELWDDIRAGRIDPSRVHDQILPFSVERQLGRLFDAHREILHPSNATQAAIGKEA